MYEDEEIIDDLFLETSFEEMESDIKEEEYIISVTKERNGDIALSDMLLEEVNCLEKRLAGEDVPCSVTNMQWTSFPCTKCVSSVYFLAHGSFYYKNR